MKLTFEGNLDDIIEEMIYVLDHVMGIKVEPRAPAEPAEAPAPKPAPKKPAAKKPAPRPSKAALAPVQPVPDPVDDEEEEDDDDANIDTPAFAKGFGDAAVGNGAALGAAAALKVKEETLAILQKAWQAGKLAQLRNLLSAYGGGAKTFPEIEATKFNIIAEAIGDGALD